MNVLLAMEAVNRYAPIQMEVITALVKMGLTYQMECFVLVY